MLKKRVPDFLKVMLKRLAFHLFRLSRRFFTGPFDKYDFQAIEVFRQCLKADSNCIDVGAHAGHILREMLRAAPLGKHIAIEPIPDLYKRLQKRFGKRVQIWDLALSDREGRVEFTYYPERPALSGFRQRKQAAAYKAILLEVQTRRLDDLIPAELRIDLIKIDVEGAEWQVLKGARRILEKDKPIVLFECGLGGADAYDTPPEDIFDLFKQCGLSINLMEYFLDGKEALTREEFSGQFHKRYNFFFMAYDSRIHPAGS